METSEAGTNLKVVGGSDVEHGIVPHDGDEPYADLRQSILELKDSMDKSRWEMASLFFRVNDENIYHRWGFNKFEEYIEVEVGMSSRTAQYLVGMFNWFVHEIGPHMSDEDREEMINAVKSLGWTKARCLVGITDASNVMEWIERAAELSSTELQSLARKALVEKKGGNSKAVEDCKRMSFTFPDDSYTVVEQAIDMAKEIAGSDKRGYLLSLVCQDYVATTKAQKDKGQKNRSIYFNKIGDQFGVHLIAVDKDSGKVVHNDKVLKQLGS